VTEVELPGRVRARWTEREEGDLGVASAPGVEQRRRQVLDRPWSWLRQVHGADIVRVDDGPVEGLSADALISHGAHRGALAIFTADCGPVALASPEGLFGAVHAGWKGLRAGVVQAAVSALRDAGAGDLTAVIGPCIHPECYEFSPADLSAMAEIFGPGVSGRTATGQPALDLPKTIRLALESAGIAAVVDLSVCTSCSPAHWSHRARQDPERQALVMWSAG
jgi:YfiH family protein